MWRNHGSHVFGTFNGTDLLGRHVRYVMTYVTYGVYDSYGRDISCTIYVGHLVLDKIFIGIVKTLGLYRDGSNNFWKGLILDEAIT